jgi:hypothetical protein
MDSESLAWPERQPGLLLAQSIYRLPGIGQNVLIDSVSMEYTPNNHEDTHSSIH